MSLRLRAASPDTLGVFARALWLCTCPYSCTMPGTRVLGPLSNTQHPAFWGSPTPNTQPLGAAQHPTPSLLGQPNTLTLNTHRDCDIFS